MAAFHGSEPCSQGVLCRPSPKGTPGHCTSFLEGDVTHNHLFCTLHGCLSTPQTTEPLVMSLHLCRIYRPSSGACVPYKVSSRLASCYPPHLTNVGITETVHQCEVLQGIQSVQSLQNEAGWGRVAADRQRGHSCSYPLPHRVKRTLLTLGCAGLWSRCFPNTEFSSIHCSFLGSI